MTSRVLIAPDKFKGTLTATQVADAIAAGLHRAELAIELDIAPIADGGDGTAAVLREALGGEWRAASAIDPLRRPIEASYALIDEGRTAVVEVAAASGLALLDPTEFDPLAATSAGTGELIAAAIESGVEEVLVGCGGSASTDAGRGALERFDPAAVRLTCLCDVSDPFMGALRYARQKGGGRKQLDALERRMQRSRSELPHDPARLPFSGAAGGLAGGLWAHGARLVSGADYVLDRLAINERLGCANLVITGEGRLDSTSLSGKAVGRIAARARSAGVRCAAIVGQDGLAGEDGRARFARICEAGTREEIAAAAPPLIALLDRHPGP